MLIWPDEVLARPFGAASREWLLERYFGAQPPITPDDAWRHVYRLLLWIDRTTGLAHCYESDKSQAGRHWYARSLAFHRWLSQEFSISPRNLTKEVDWLFKQATQVLALAEATAAERREKRAQNQRKPYAADDMPESGEYPELEQEIGDLLVSHYGSAPPDKLLRAVVLRVRETLRVENKRKNLVGEGFEDVLGTIISRVPGGAGWSVKQRTLLHELPGFRVPPGKEKPRRVDLTLIHAGGRRILATVKWSVRADREEQFGVDFDAYVRCEEWGKDFEFVFITNEFDAGRLVNACDRRAAAAALFSGVIHVNPEGLLQVHKGDRSTARRMRDLIAAGRLQGLREWLSGLVSPTP